MSLHYFEDWDTRTWTCANCNWQGPGSDCTCEHFAELFELRCPKCNGKFTLIRTVVSMEEARASAAVGNEEAAAHVILLQNAAAFQEQLAESRNGRGKLPALPRGKHTFAFTTGGDDEDWMSPAWLVLLADGVEIYREGSGYEGWEAIIEISEQVLKRYPRRVLWIDPAEVGSTLLGDDLSASGEIQDFLKNHGITPPTGNWAAS